MKPQNLIEGKLQYQRQIYQFLEEWLYPRVSQSDQGLFYEEEKQESIQIEGWAPDGAIIINQAPEGKTSNIVVVNGHRRWKSWEKK